MNRGELVWRGRALLTRVRHGRAVRSLDSVVIGPAHIPSGVTIGRHVFVNTGCRLMPGVVLEDFAILGPGVFVVGDDHRTDLVGTPVLFSGRPAVRPTTVAIDAWIGARATVMAGVRIGAAAIVASGAVVTRDVADGSIVAGVPAREIGRRFHDPADLESHVRRLRAPGPWSLADLATSKAVEDGSVQRSADPGSV